MRLERDDFAIFLLCPLQSLLESQILSALSSFYSITFMEDSNVIDGNVSLTIVIIQLFSFVLDWVNVLYALPTLISKVLSYE